MRPAGTPSEWSLHLVSRPGLPALRLSLDDDLPAIHASLPAEERTRVTLDLPAAPRGYQPLPEVKIATTFPLGLWRVERRLRPSLGQWIYPSPIAGPSHDVQLDHDGETGSQRDPGGDPTHLRAYQPGDPMRRIVFRHYAKTGRLVSRQTEGEPQAIEPVVIDYDHYRGSVEVRLSAMTQRLLSLSERGEPWTLRLPGIRPISSSGATSETSQARRQALRHLARFERRRDAMGFDHVPPGTEGSW
nr:DUF58 domain-containing protein [Guyparkeria hydrothermalis]